MQRTVTIASGVSLSGAVDLEGLGIVRIAMPAAWTAADLTFQLSDDEGVTYYDAYDSAGAEVTVTAAASRVIAIPATTLSSIRHVKVRSGTSAAPTNQGADRVIALVLRGYA